MTTSYNGWPASTDKASIGVDKNFAVHDVAFPGGVKAGDVAVVLAYVMEQFHLRVEPLVAGWCWGYNYRQNRNADNLSCHSSATAVDANAPRHPNGKRGTFNPVQVGEIRLILHEVSPAVKWGGDFRGTPDEMHFEIAGNAAVVKAVADRIRQKQEGNEMTPAQEKKVDELTVRVNKLQATVEAVDRHLKAHTDAIKELVAKTHPGANQ